MKYAALTLSSVATALLVAALVAIAQGIGTKGYSNLPLPASLSPLSEKQLQGQADVKVALQALMHASAERQGTINSVYARSAMLPVAAYSGFPSHTGPYDSIFALPAPLEPVKPMVMQAQTPLKSMPLPKVSLVMQSGAEGKAIVDGHLRKVGDTVAKGLTVKSIAIDTVTLTNGREDVLIQVPLERLRVMGAYPDAQAKAR